MRQLLTMTLLMGLSILCVSLYAQKKLVVMGSSTAAGNGASSASISWVGLLTSQYKKNLSDNTDTTIVSIARGGYSTYLEMPSGFIPPAGRPSPDNTANVTKALSYNPDIVIINLPTNDIGFGYSKKEFLDNLKLMYNTIISAPSKPKCYITTTQPRSLSTSLRDSLQSLADSIKNIFGSFAIDFWTDLTTTDGLNNILPAVSVGDGIHINDLGHGYLYQRTLSKNIFAISQNALPLILTAFKASLVNKTVALSWQIEEENPGSSFDIERSANGSAFESIETVLGKGNRSSSNFYSWADISPLSGRSYYRLKITEPSGKKYSDIIAIENKDAPLMINRVYVESRSKLTANIVLQKTSTVSFEIISLSGAIVYKKTLFIVAPSATVHIPIEQLQRGQYYFRVITADNFKSVIGFIK